MMIMPAVRKYPQELRERFGVDPICRVRTEHGCKIPPSTYYAARRRTPSTRALCDAELVEQMEAVLGP